MKKTLQGLCAGLCAAILCWMGLKGGGLPRDVSPLIGEKYAGWSGVLRVWVFEGWTDGGAFAGWLNRCATAFERRHSGVYVQAKYVDAAAIADFMTSGARPPHMIVFPPGLLADGTGLTALELTCRTALEGCGGGYAAPLLLGGYGWAISEGGGVLAPPDEEWRDWTAALGGLGLPSEPDQTPEPPGIDLGLPVMAGEEVARAADALTRFVNGECGAAAVGFTELRRLDRLAAQGKGPDWTLRGGGFTDQALYMGVVAGEAEALALALRFAGHLLGDECQALLREYGAFTVTDLPSGYAASEPRRAIQAALESDGLRVAAAFSGGL